MILSIRVFNPQAPHLYNRLTITDARGRERRRVRGRPTYSYQLGAFAAAVRDGPEAGHVLTPPADGLANMRVIDDIYRAAGLSPRPGRLA
jgi:predicted dehydrogenase